MIRSSALVLLSTILVGISGCRRGKDNGPAVATGDDVRITAQEFKAKLDEQSPFVRARYATLERKKEFLENLIRFELLAAEARRQKLDEDPEVQETIEKIMVQKLVRKAFDEDGAKSVSDDELKKYYAEHQDEFVKPDRRRVSLVFLRAGDPSARAARAGEARKIVGRIKAEETKNPLAFASVAREVSDDLATKNGGGDLGYRTRDEIEKAYGPRVTEAAMALKSVGDESSVIEAEQGFYVLKLTGTQPGLDRSLDDVKAQLGPRLARERRTRDFDEFVKKLRDKAGIKVVDAELEKIPVTGAPATAAGAPESPKK